MQRWFFLLRAFFPSWNFFSASGAEPHLSVRYGINPETLSDWSVVFDPVPRKFSNLVFNPFGNLLHAQRNALQHLLMDVESEKMNFESKTTYCIVRNSVEVKVRSLLAQSFDSEEIKKESNEPLQWDWYFQFKIEVIDPLTKPDMILISPTYPLKLDPKWK